MKAGTVRAAGEVGAARRPRRCGWLANSDNRAAARYELTPVRQMKWPVEGQCVPATSTGHVRRLLLAALQRFLATIEDGFTRFELNPQCMRLAVVEHGRGRNAEAV